jgi:hypothetical protein
MFRKSAADKEQIEILDGIEVVGIAGESVRCWTGSVDHSRRAPSGVRPARLLADMIE